MVLHHRRRRTGRTLDGGGRGSGRIAEREVVRALTPLRNRLRRRGLHLHRRTASWTWRDRLLGAGRPGQIEAQAHSLRSHRLDFLGLYGLREWRLEGEVVGVEAEPHRRHLIGRRALRQAIPFGQVQFTVSDRDVLVVHLFR